MMAPSIAAAVRRPSGSVVPPWQAIGLHISELNMTAGTAMACRTTMHRFAGPHERIVT